MSESQVWQPACVKERLGVRLRRAAFALRRLLMSRLADEYLTHEQYLILLYLGEQPAISQNELARRTFTNPNTLKDILNHLQSLEWAQRVPHPLDARINQVQITREGQRQRRRLMELADELVGAVLGRLSADERDGLLRGLDAVAQNAEETLVAAPQPVR